MAKKNDLMRLTKPELVTMILKRDQLLAERGDEELKTDLERCRQGLELLKEGRVILTQNHEDEIKQLQQQITDLEENQVLIPKAFETKIQELKQEREKLIDELGLAETNHISIKEKYHTLRSQIEALLNE